MTTHGPAAEYSIVTDAPGHAVAFSIAALTSRTEVNVSAYLFRLN